MIRTFQILTTGSSGLVASDFKRLCQKEEIPFYGLDLHGEESSVDITDSESLEKTVSSIIAHDSFRETIPVLFHFAAITITGNNLTPEQVDLTKKINITGTKNVAEVCRKFHIPMVHISTDFVYAGGGKITPYLPYDPLAPDTTVYSQTKAEAERVVMSFKDENKTVIIRPAFPYGNHSHPKPGLDRKMAGWLENAEVRLFNDQHTCPTPISYFSECCLQTAKRIAQDFISSGTVLHGVGRPTTPFEFGTLIKQFTNKPAEIIPSHIENGPKNLVLDTSDTEKLLGLTPPSHEEVLRSLFISKN